MEQVNNNVLELTSNTNVGETNNETQSNLLNVLSMEEFVKQVSEKLKNYEFRIVKNKLTKFKNSGLADIGNIIPYIKTKIIRSNGIDEKIKYIIGARNLETNETLPEIEMTLNQYNSFKGIIGSEWDGVAIVEPNKEQYLKLVTQILAKDTMEKEYIYEHTGFRRINDKLCFLAHGKVIGDVTNVKADLSEDKLEQYNFTDKEFEEREAINRSVSFLDVADKKITIPIFSTIFISPLISILQEEGITADYILYIVGASGRGKSSLTSVGLSFFGDNFERNNFPCSFTSTINNLEKKAYILKDVLNIIDDMNDDSKIDTFKGLLGNYGDRTGRGRMMSDGTSLRRTYTARGTCIVTGEFIPNLPLSRLARCVIVPFRINNQDEYWKKLTELQKNKEQLAYCMILFIKWIILREQDIRESVKRYMFQLRERQDNKIHGRTNESVNIMWLGYALYLNFLQDYQIITADEKQKLSMEGLDILLSISANQQEEIETSNPINMFYNAIEELLDTGKIYLYDYAKGSKPKVTELVSGKSKGTAVGFIDKKKQRYYFYPTVIYNEVCKFYAFNNSKFTLSALNLWRYLQEEGLLEMTDESRKTVLRTDTFTNKKVRIVDVKIRRKEDNQQEQLQEG